MRPFSSAITAQESQCRVPAKPPMNPRLLAKTNCECCAETLAPSEFLLVFDAANAAVHRHAERAVAVVLDGVGFALAHRHREAVGLAQIAVAAARAGQLRALEDDPREAAQLGRIDVEARGSLHEARYDK